MVIGGVNYAPADIEAVLEEAVPGLRRGCVIAFGIDDGRTEKAVVMAELASSTDASTNKMSGAASSGVHRHLMSMAIMNFVMAMDRVPRVR
jgi:hypothetical protein